MLQNLLKNPENFDPEYPHAQIFVGHDGREVWCADLGDILYAQSVDDERYWKSLEPFFEDVAKMEELQRKEDELYKIPDSFETKF